MQRCRLALLAASWLSVVAIAGCDYAKKSDLDALQAKYQATHDTLVALWEATDTRFMALARKDTIPPPPCPPFCETLRVLRTSFPPPPERGR
jgi:hypothetical protein